MPTNRFAARCTVCGDAVAPGEGIVLADDGARRVRHHECTPATATATAPPLVHRTLDDHDLHLPPAPAPRRGRVVGGIAALGLVGVGLVAALAGGDAGDGGRTQTDDRVPTTLPASPTAAPTVPVAVAGATETRVTAYVAGVNTPTPSVPVATTAPPTTEAPPTTTPPPAAAPPETSAPIAAAPTTEVPTTEAPPPPAPSTTQAAPPPTAAPTTAPPVTQPPRTTTTRRNRGRDDD